MQNEMLQPNCSEVCWRLNISNGSSIQENIVRSLLQVEIDEDGFSHSDDNDLPFMDMVYQIEDFIKKGVDQKDIYFEVIENTGGSGEEDLEKCFNIALKYCDKKITKEQALAKISKLENYYDDE